MENKCTSDSCPFSTNGKSHNWGLSPEGWEAMKEAHKRHSFPEDECDCVPNGIYTHYCGKHFSASPELKGEKTLIELIEACGKDFDNIRLQDVGSWTATDKKGNMVLSCASPEEAVVKLLVLIKGK